MSEGNWARIDFSAGSDRSEAINTLPYQRDEISPRGNASYEDLYKFLNQSRDTTALLKRVHTLIYRKGFDQFCCMLLNSVHDIRNQNGNYSEALREAYIADDLHTVDFMLQHALLSETPKFGAELFAFLENAPVANKLLEKNLAIQALLRQHNIHDYYCISFDSQSGRGRFIFFVTKTGADIASFQNNVRQFQPMLAALARALDHIGFKKFPDTLFPLKKPSKNILNPRPLQLLQTLANHNVMLNEAADMLHISISTANQQIAAAKKALGANTTASAIVAALKLGLIKIDRISP